MISLKIQVCACLLLAFTMAACSDADRNGSREAASRADFGSFARTLYAELDRAPVSSGVETEIGLFGDLSVTAGEEVVMGRYRYLADSSAEPAVGHMAFHIRESDSDVDPVPVVLRFVRNDSRWRLEGASVLTRNVDMQAHDRTQQEPVEVDSDHDGLQKTVNDNLKPWVETAIARAGLR